MIRCRHCDRRPIRGRLCERCRKRRPDDPFFLPEDFDDRVAILDARIDPLAIPMKCWCGKEAHPETRYVVALLESRCIEVCSVGHVTLMRRHGTHTYDQHERAEAEAGMREKINAVTAETKRRNGTENPRSRRCGER